MNKKYQPIGNTVLVEAVNVNTTLELPESVQPDQYTIVAKGTGDRVPKELKKGDVVILSPGAFLTKVKNTNYSVTNSDSVLVRVV